MLRLTSFAARDQAGAAAAWLQDAGVVEGDRLGIAPVLEADIPQAERQQAAILSVVWGALSVGVIPVMVNPDLTERERSYVLTDCDPAVILESTEALVELTAHAGCAPLPLYPRGRPMHYTSGTTGSPKGVWSGVLSDEEAAALWGDEISLWGITASDTSLVHGPLAHSGPLRFALYALLAGGDVLLPGRFQAARLAAALRDERPSTAFVVPSHIQRLLELGSALPPSPYRLLVHAGSACPPALKEAIHGWAGANRVWEFYGSTEGQFTAMPGTDWPAHAGSVGKARHGRELRIIDGTIWCRPPASGHFEYWRDPRKTAAAWRVIDGEQWFTAGDLGHLDDDGYLYIDGRRADLIISGGLNVYPAEVEGVLVEFAGVQDAAVYGVPDDRWGQRVCAAIIGDVDISALDVWLRSRLAGYKRPKEIHIVTGLPSTASGKTKRLSVAQVVADQ